MHTTESVHETPLKFRSYLELWFNGNLEAGRFSKTKVPFALDWFDYYQGCYTYGTVLPKTIRKNGKRIKHFPQVYWTIDEVLASLYSANLKLVKTDVGGGITVDELACFIPPQNWTLSPVQKETTPSNLASDKGMWSTLEYLEGRLNERCAFDRDGVFIHRFDSTLPPRNLCQEADAKIKLCKNLELLEALVDASHE